MKPLIIVYRTLSPTQLARLREHYDLIELSDLAAADPATLTRAVGLIGSDRRVDAALLAKMPALRAVSTISVGYDYFDLAVLTARRIPLMYTPTVLTQTVADTGMLLILMTARRGLELAGRVKRGEWQDSIDRSWYGVDVHHKTLGIIGMGRIGMALAARAHGGFSMPILYHSRRRHPQAESLYQARYCTLDSLLSEADFVCSILPLTEQTRGLLGAAQFARMRPSAIFINIGRGQVVDEAALITALQTGQIHAAGLDVFAHEPLAADSPLLALPGVVALPHIGSATHETRYNMEVCAVDNLLNALQGDLSQNCVNAQQLSGK